MISSELTSSITGTEKLIILKEREKKENDQEIVGSITETVVINWGRTSWQIDETLLEFSFSERNRLTAIINKNKFILLKFHLYLLGDGRDSISISTSSSSSSSLKWRIDELISAECCRTIGISGTKALDEWLELTSNVVGGDDNDGLEKDRSGW